MAGLFVNVQLEVLVPVQEASSGFKHQKVVGILLRYQVGVVSVTQWRFHLDDLARHLLTEAL